MTRHLWILLGSTSQIVLLIGIIVGFIYFRYLDRGFRMILLYLAIALIIELLARYFGLYSSVKNNLFLIPIYGFLELAVISILYYKYIFRISSIPLLLFIALMLSIILFEIALTPGKPDPKSYHSFGKLIADITIIFFSMFYYWRVFKGKIPINSQYSLLNAAIFSYYSINFIIYLALNFMLNGGLGIVTFFWIFNAINVISFYLVLIYLLWQNGKTRKILQ